MTGLLKKDFRLLANYGKAVVLMMGVFLVAAIYLKNISFSAGVIMIMSLLMTVNTISYDDMAHFTEFSVTLPLSRTKQVVEKYMLSFCILTIGVGIVAVLNVIFRILWPENTDMMENVSSMLLCLAIGLVMLSLMIPLVYKFGAEKARVIIILIGVSPALLLTLVMQGSENAAVASISDQMLFLLFSSSPLIGIACMAISCLISIRIFKNKEF